VNLETGFGGEERMPHQRRVPYHTFEPSAGAINIVERWRVHD
jgi:hypothetical protein